MASTKQTMLLGKIEFDNYLIGEEGQPVKQYRVGIVKPAKVTNAKIIKNICDHTGYPRAQVKGVLDSIGECVNDYLELGATVELENFITIKPLIKVKAVMDKADATAATIKSRSIRCVAIGDFASMAKAWGFQLNSSDVSKGEANDDNGGVDDGGDDNTPGGDNSQNGGGGTTNNTGGGGTNTGGGTQTPTNRTITYKHQGATYTTQEYAVGAAVTAPSAPAGYQWMGVPSTMPDRDMEVNSYANGGGGLGGDDMDL